MARRAHNGLQRDRIAVVVIVTTTTIHTLKSPRHGLYLCLLDVNLSVGHKTYADIVTH